MLHLMLTCLAYLLHAAANQAVPCAKNPWKPLHMTTKHSYASATAWLE